jgi:hypothetical protein
MPFLFRAALIGLAAVSLSACMGSRHYEGPGRYLVRGPGYHIVSGPYPDASACHKAAPAKLHSQTYVCIFVPQDARDHWFKRAAS